VRNAQTRPETLAPQLICPTPSRSLADRQNHEFRPIQVYVLRLGGIQDPIRSLMLQLWLAPAKITPREQDRLLGRLLRPR
jgi:hypothetical protein